MNMNTIGLCHTIDPDSSYSIAAPQDSGSHAMDDKQRLINILLVVIAAALLLMACYFPQPGDGSLFTMHTMPAPFLVAAASLIAAGFLTLITYWYDNSIDPIDLGAAVTAFLGGGVLALLITALLYPAWSAAAMMGQTGGAPLLQQAGTALAAMARMNGDAGPVEELAKLLALLLIPSVRICIEDGKSGAFYAMLCALGFAMLENLYYLFDDASSLWWRITPAHAVFSSIWGYALGAWMAKQISATSVILFLLAAMGLHSMY
ncbi:MAG: PrsW family glutamic-type intramembrane protease, partial [Mariprofundales bacterium]|nr:PrsW family glutamic-type intramembrane protease [Mariprofundales bacterium]